MMKKTVFFAACALLASVSDAAAKRPAPVRVNSEHIALDNVTGAVSVSGDTMVTTCTNDLSCLHWKLCGEGSGQRDKYVMFKGMWVYLWDVPVMWMPYWFYPMDTEYGLRMMPGYSSRWGAYLLSKYVYNIAGSSAPGEYGLKGATRLDLRSENGIALGQSLRWNAGDFGKGVFKVYYVWDLDADHYDRHWDDDEDWNYRNWGSTVPDERYALNLSHRVDLSERDIVRLQGAVYSDSYFHRDFLRQSLFGIRNRFVGYGSNELAWEHNENQFGFGASVTGPLDEFYGGVARLPEFYFDVLPMPVFALPVNYESSSRMGYLNRNYAKYGDDATIPAFAYNPGVWADYNTFRMDTYHRLTAPFKLQDTLSVVPRFGLRGTYWGDSGYESLSGTQRAGRTGDDVWRSIVEGGVTFAARGEAWIDGKLRHITEPYLDFLCQEARYSARDNGTRTYVFDSVDASMGWQDQFAGRSRNLPYSWYGMTPGWRNAWIISDDRGNQRTVFDLDVYAAIQFNDTDFTRGTRHHRLSSDPENPNYGEDPEVVPGFRVRWLPHADMSVSARVEYDCENDNLAYADLNLKHKLNDRFDYYAKYVVRDFRWWDYSSTPYDSAYMRRDEFNWVDYQYFEIGCEHELADWFAWGPYILWDASEGELNEIGTWFDYRTDCLGFRLSIAYEHEYERIDRSKAEEDWRVGFFIYLRAIGPESGSPFGD